MTYHFSFLLSFSTDSFFLCTLFSRKENASQEVGKALESHIGYSYAEPQLLRRICTTTLFFFFFKPILAYGNS